MSRSPRRSAHTAATRAARQLIQDDQAAREAAREKPAPQRRDFARARLQLLEACDPATLPDPTREEMYRLLTFWGVLADAPEPAPAVPHPSQPGRFEIVGVDGDSGFDTRWVTHAESEDAARAKAERRGIIVTSMRRV